MNIAIVDDEKIIREQIKGLIQKRVTDNGMCCPGICEPDAYETGEELLAAGKRFDIIFLDIQMKGKDGIETARELRKRKEDAVLIFVTGIREYVFEAFDVAAFHYLLKPIEEEKFAEVFDRAVKEVMKRKEQGREQLFIKTRNRNITLDKKDILYVENRGRKVEIHTTGEVIEVYAVMKELEEQLGGNFYRCHRGYLVNMAYIAEYSSASIRLGNGENIYLAKERYHEFVKTYMRYLRNGGTACV
ncbi:MAG: response regulator transcription factor [Lachnospiraceae bacterium]|nr:response regulator transcription factor [Lachnospiraceae bacterium]